MELSDYLPLAISYDYLRDARHLELSPTASLWRAGSRLIFASAKSLPSKVVTRTGWSILTPTLLTTRCEQSRCRTTAESWSIGARSTPRLLQLALISLRSSAERLTTTVTSNWLRGWISLSKPEGPRQHLFKAFMRRRTLVQHQLTSTMALRQSFGRCSELMAQRGEGAIFVETIEHRLSTSLYNRAVPAQGISR